MKIQEKVAVLGASPKRDRYSNRAVRELMSGGYDVVPVHPAHSEIEGLPVAENLGAVTGKVHTVTVYVSAGISSGLGPELIALHPERVIFNPGTENESLEATLRENNIRVVEACTLVLLRVGRFDTA